MLQGRESNLLPKTRQQGLTPSGPFRSAPASASSEIISQQPTPAALDNTEKPSCGRNRTGERAHGVQRGLASASQPIRIEANTPAVGR